MGKRWQTQQVKSVLDVGCGVGHWGFLLKDILPKTTTLTGVDREPEWIKTAQERAQTENLAHRYTYTVGDVNQLPFEDSSFDMVTCQTLLIHVSNVKNSVLEMCRVLKPGGILVLIEPNNIGRTLSLSTLDMNTPMDDILEITRFQMLCERGKQALNEGYISIGDQLPGYLAEMKLEEIQVFISDKAKTFFPPYDSPEQEAIIQEIQEWSKKNFWIWDESETKRFYLAGGGDASLFEYYWEKALYRQNQRFLEGIEAHSYATSGGKLTYCISARKSN